MGAVRRPATSKDVDELKISERHDHGEEEDHHRDRQQEGPGYEPEALPGIRPIDSGGLHDCGVDGLKAGKERNGEEGHSSPDINKDNRAHGRYRTT